MELKYFYPSCMYACVRLIACLLCVLSLVFVYVAVCISVWVSVYCCVYLRLIVLCLSSRVFVYVIACLSACVSVYCCEYVCVRVYLSISMTMACIIMSLVQFITQANYSYSTSVSKLLTKYPSRLLNRF